MASTNLELVKTFSFGGPAGANSTFYSDSFEIGLKRTNPIIWIYVLNYTPITSLGAFTVEISMDGINFHTSGFPSYQMTKISDTSYYLIFATVSLKIYPRLRIKAVLGNAVSPWTADFKMVVKTERMYYL